MYTVHRSCIKTDLIEHFKDPSLMNCNVVFKIINDQGELKLGLGTGVNSEVYTLFWNEFSISMTIRIGRGFHLLGMTILLKSGSLWEEFF